VTSPNRVAHLAYVVTIAIKGFDGALETILGAVIALTGTSKLYAWFLTFTAPELYGDDSKHPISRFLQAGALKLVDSPAGLIVSYLLIHGILKLILAVVLLRGGGRWIFPLATAILVGFIGFMCWHLAESWSNWVLGFAIFDFATLLLVLNEWRNPVRRPDGRLA
jgi:uncharacterized membrane protein